MPEGHTLHRLARLHQRRFAGAPVAVSSPQGRFASEAAVVNGQVMKRASVWGKHLFHHYADGPIVHVHLGLYGTFTEWQRGPELPEAVGQVRMRMIGADYGTDLRGPTVCEVVDEARVSDVVAKVGFTDATGCVRYRRPDGAGIELTFPVEPDAVYPDGGCQVELWMQYPTAAPIGSLEGLHPSARLVELEILSPLHELAPGASASFDFSWTVQGPHA